MVFTISVLLVLPINIVKTSAIHVMVFTINAIVINSIPGYTSTRDVALYSCKANSIVPIVKLIMAMALLVIIKFFIGVLQQNNQ